MGIKGTIKKTFLKKKRQVKKRYIKPKTGTLRLGRLASDVAVMKKILNVEKKSFTLFPTSSTIGQCNANGNGSFILDITPTPAQGVAANQITGESFKLTGVFLEMQVLQQSALHSDAYYVFEMWDVRGTPTTTGNAYAQLFNVSTFTNLYDAYSTRNQNSYADFRLMKRWYMSFPQDSLSGTNQVKTKQIAMKLNKHVRQTALSATTNGQILLSCRSNYGNSSTTTASTTPNVATTAINTGAVVLFTAKFWYVDN